MKYTIYEPSRTTPGTAPVIFHLHGFGGADRVYYDFYLSHLAMRGYVAVFVEYHPPVSVQILPQPLPRSIQLPLPWQPQINAIAVVKDALDRLQGRKAGDVPHVQPERGASGSPRIALSGHSLGGILALRLAALAELGEIDIPVPEAIVLHDASTDLWKDKSPTGAVAQRPTKDLATSINSKTDLMIIVEDTSADTWDAAANFSLPAFVNTPAEHSNVFGPQTDRTGDPESNDLVSNHFACSWLPASDFPAGFIERDDPVNTLDYWACNRLSEATFNFAFDRAADNGNFDPFCNETGDCDYEVKMGNWFTSSGAGPDVKSMLVGTAAFAPKPKETKAP